MTNILIALILLIIAFFQFDGAINLVDQLWQFESFILVFLGTLTATILQFPMRQLKMVGVWTLVAFKPRKINFKKDIDLICDVSNHYQTQGSDSLVGVIESNKNQFLTKALVLIMDGASVEVVEQSCKDTMAAIKKRHEVGVFFFEQMAKYAPGFGLLGTVVGLIKLLSSLTSPSVLGQGMALALVTTFYGIFLSNLIFQPIAGRLFVLDKEEAQHNSMIMTGIVGMAQGLPALIIKEKMMMQVNNKRMALE